MPGVIVYPYTGTIKKGIGESGLGQTFDNIENIDVKLSTLQRTRAYEQTFESGSTDTITNNATQTVQNTEVYAGTYALQVTIPAGQTGYVETPRVPTSPGMLVTFSFAHKEDANISSLKLVAVWYRPNGNVISVDEFDLTPSTSWQVDNRTVTAPQNAAYMSLRMEATAGASDGNVYLDDMFIDIVGQVLRVDSEGQIKVADTNLLNALKPTRATPEQVLSGVLISAGGTQAFTVDDGDGYSAVVITVKATYDNLATAGVRVRWLYSPDGVNFDSVEDAEAQGNYEDLRFAAGKTRQRTILIPLFQPYVKVQVINQDPAYPVTVDAWKTLMR